MGRLDSLERDSFNGKETEIMLKKIKNNDREKTHFSDLVGVDFSSTGTKVVRIKQSKGSLTLVGMDILPAVDLTEEPEPFSLPRNLTTNYCCLSYTGTNAVVRMINTVVAPEMSVLPEKKVRELLNVSDEFRVSAQLIKRGKDRQDSRFLAAAIPNRDVEQLLGRFPSGPPAAASLEISGLSFVSAFLHARGAECADTTVCLLETGETMSHFTFLTNGQVTLVGKMSFGAKVLREKLAEELGLDEELAISILSDASVNISSSVVGVVAPYIKQLSISRDFIERHQGERISRLYLSGGLSLLPSWGAEIGRLLGMHVAHWSPLENIECSLDGHLEKMIKQATRFSAAIGAAIGGMEAK